MGILALRCLTIGPALAADPVSSYRDVLAALQSEKVVKVVSDLNRCTTADGKAGPPVQGGLVINGFNVVPARGILFSDVHLTLDPAGRPLTEYIRYDFGEDNKLTLTVTRLSADGTAKEDIFVCAVPAAARFVW
jgi:hypothetical protein